MHEENAAFLDLRGHLLTVGSDGLNARYSEYRPFIKSGKITSTGDFLTIKSHTMGSSQVNPYGDPIFYTFGVDSIIEDHKNHKVGLIINGKHPRGERGIVGLGGERANTFTGDVIVEGVGNKLYLSKADGVTVIKGNIYVKNNANLVFFGSNQVSDSSVITLSGRNSAVGFTGLVKNVSEKIHALVVQSGTGILSFGHNPQVVNDQSHKTFF